MGIPIQRFDMSEYMERHSVSRLIGAPPGYVGYDQGGLLTDAIDQQPHCVLLLDEIEKAHPDLFNILLQVMDNGRLTDHHGKTVDFRNVVLIMTTNAGASDMAKQGIGFGDVSKEDAGDEAVKKMFTPEFRNRLDAIVPFAYLPTEVMPGGRQVHPPAGTAAGRPERPHPVRQRCPRMAGPSAAMTSSMARGRWPASSRRRSSSRWPRNCCSASCANGGEVHVSLKDDAGVRTDAGSAQAGQAEEGQGNEESKNKLMLLSQWKLVFAAISATATDVAIDCCGYGSNNFV